MSVIARATRLACALVAAACGSGKGDDDNPPAPAPPEVTSEELPVPPGVLLPRSDHTATLLASGRVLVVGGNETTDDRNAVLYDPAARSLRPAAPLAGTRVFHTATLLRDGRVLVAGGEPPRTPEPLASTALYEPALDRWSPGPPLAQPRQGHVAAVLGDGRVLVAGGFDRRVALASAEIFDPVRGAWAAAEPMPGARQGHAAVLLPDGRVLVVGGIVPVGELTFELPRAIGGEPGQTVDVEQQELTAEVLRFDPASGRWHKAAPLPAARSGHHLARLTDGRVLLVAGATGTLGRPGVPMKLAEAAEALLYDPAADRWTPAGSVLSGGRSLGALVAMPDGGALYLGGMRGLTMFSKLDRFAPDTGWATPRDLGFRTSVATATLLGDGTLFLVGHGKARIVTPPPWPGR